MGRWPSSLGRGLLSASQNEFSWDEAAFRRRWVKDPWGAISSRAEGPVLLDEIHKDRRWKSRIKGLFDMHGADVPIVVTGSARLDLFRRGGDSLMGRHLPYRLHRSTKYGQIVHDGNIFDVLGIPDPGPRKENLAARHLLKACHCWTDLGLGEFELRYLTRP
jgi:hypothetical protein